MHLLNKEFPEQEDLPVSYGRDQLVLLARDPYWLFAYWELSPSTLWSLESETQPICSPLMLALRVYRYRSNKQQNNLDAESSFDLKISPSVDNWYIKAGVPDRTYQVALGYCLPGEGFKPFLTSNLATTPRDKMSAIMDENWRLPDWQARRLYRRISLSNLSSPERLMLQSRPLALYTLFHANS